MPAKPGRKVLIGVSRLARFRIDGFPCFGDTPTDFLNSLAPLIAFPLVGALIVLLTGGGVDALGDLLTAVVALLAPCVLSEAIAKSWGRERAWLHYAVAFNWCQWILPVAGIALVFATSILMGLGLSEHGAAIATLVILLCYGLCMNWFLARHGLGLTAARATVFVVLVNLGTGALVVLPRLLASSISGVAD